MKKLFLLLAVAAFSAQMNAQTVLESKNFDNWYIGVNGGANVPAATFKFDDMNFQAGLRVGRWFTPVVGLAVEGQVFMGNKGGLEFNTKTFPKVTNLGFLGTLNFNNWFGGYTGTARPFEIIGVVGAGWMRDWNVKDNCMSSKVGIDFTYNFGSDKQFQLYLEPALIYNIADASFDRVCYNINRALFTASLGLNYKFGNSNGTHNFKIAELRDQAEIDGLNAQINGLRADANSRDSQIAANAKVIADLKAKLAECEARPAEVVQPKSNILQPTVIFRQGKSTIDAAQYASVEIIANYMKNHPAAKLTVTGYASTEGTAELNQKLSEDRAAAVKNALVKKYKIAADRIATEGKGATDKFSDELAFNRVAMFIDNAK